MNQTIAIPMENGKLCAHFGHCQTFAFIKVENCKIVNITEHTPPEHVPGLYPRWVAQHGATDVIAGGMGQKAVQLFHEQNINVFTGAPMDTAQEIVTRFLANNLELSANYCNHDHDHEHGHGHGCNH